MINLQLPDGSFYSKYRTTLMGIAILGVLMAHFCAFTNLHNESTIISFLNQLQNVAYIDGFLFLSGFSMYHSFSRNPNVTFFYCKRLRRVWIPYLLITILYFCFQDFYVNSYNVLSFLGHISTIGYWFEGNFNGLWYIAASILLYLLYPLIHKLVSLVSR